MLQLTGLTLIPGTTRTKEPSSRFRIPHDYTHWQQSLTFSHLAYSVISTNRFYWYNTLCTIFIVTSSLETAIEIGALTYIKKRNMWLLKKRNNRQSSDRSNRSRNSNDSGSNRGRSTPTPIITRNLKRDIPQSSFDDAESNSFTSKTNSNSQLSSLQNEARGFSGMNSRSSFYKSDSGRSMSRWAQFCMCCWSTMPCNSCTFIVIANLC